MQNYDTHYTHAHIFKRRAYFLVLSSWRSGRKKGDGTGREDREEPTSGRQGPRETGQETGEQGDKETRARETRRQDRETGRQDREPSKKHRGLSIGGGGTFATGYGSQTGP